MNRLVAVHAPAQVVGDVIVLSVELWTHGVFVHLARVQTEETDQLTAEHEAAIEAWREGEEFPEHPDHGVGEDLALGDDVGTRYELRNGMSGGTGSEWRAQWHLVPAVPDGASRLTVAIGEDAMELVL